VGTKVGYSGGIVGKYVALVGSTVAPRLVLSPFSASAVLNPLQILLSADLSHWNKYFHLESQCLNTC